ncbi:MAG: hypothetical protein CL858_19315 [Cupriavidus sp.]|jgi:hypothetical protein|uniref:hypothetical protein n=1 Tax=Cupriavidus pauculus TaxID=82633 RepID=UPI000C49864C|nr:hypothetical protein [Cupriavidus pauculus]KAB0601364.1 hypothetical protein F7R19_17535 [Cupriavidus pauculus]MBU67569.1 hypothetical protein [Cupriavidus sp.]UAL02965.1 hypothetical protein K8O84_20010 [Cupriavidus pauculus]
MLIPPQLRPGVVAPPCPSQTRVIRHRIRGFVLLLRVLLLCFHTAAHADKALPQPPDAQRPAPSFLETAATDFANSHPFHAVEGIAPLREARGMRPAPEPARPAPASVGAVAPVQATIRRVNAP